MKWLAITVVVLLVGFLGYWLVELKDRPSATETTQTDPNALGAAPEAKSGEPADPTLSPYDFEHGNLAFMYPEDWTLVEGASNSDELQVVTIESPRDLEGYYYCIDFNEYGPGQEPELEEENINVASTAPITASGVGQPLSGVIFQTQTNQITLWALADTAPAVGDTSFASSVTNPAGRTLQSFARFNCREDQLPSISPENFQNSRLFDESLIIFTNLTY